MRQEFCDSEIRQLCVRAQGGSASAGDQLLRIHMGLVVRAARSFYRFGMFMELGDLVQQGSLGLLHAIGKFNSAKKSRGRLVKFSTYAYFWVRHFIRREIENHGRTIAVPIGRIKEAGLPRMEWMEDEQGTAWARCVDAEDAAEHWCRAWENRRCVERLLASLPRKHQDILRWRFGLDGARGEMTQKEVGLCLNVSESRIGLLERASLLHLRRDAARMLQF